MAVLRLVIEAIGVIATVAMALILYAESVGWFDGRTNAPGTAAINELRDAAARLVAADPASVSLPVVPTPATLEADGVSSPTPLYRVTEGTFTLSEGQGIELAHGRHIVVLVDASINGYAEFGVDGETHRLTNSGMIHLGRGCTLSLYAVQWRNDTASFRYTCQ